ncbi:GAF domain-containing protein [Pelotomaculum sp. FP]|uniref:GAF domain-containing protein n=1 Tax=Pelotomaculum sp. FP TaxID=261474 RepID=UPI001864B4BC|nr:GAF domain-containing protein [Pelotomaculum sp. FP]
MDFSTKETLEFAHSNYPVVCWIVIAILLFTFITIVAIAIKRYYKGDDITFFWFFTISKNEKFAEANEKFRLLQNEYDIVSENSKQKSILLDLFNDIHKGIDNLLTASEQDQFYNLRAKLIDLILAGILSPFTKHTGNVHRVALFTPNKNRTGLVSTQFCGFFPGEYSGGISLPLNSIAGHVFITGNSYKSSNVHMDRVFFKDQKHRTDYFSLLCVPIMNKERCCGVLSLDGRKENSFDESDEKHLSYFATLIGIILETEFYVEDIKLYEIERRYSNAGSSGAR